jgi:4-hydroxybenzoate polyprenyltransferase
MTPSSDPDRITQDAMPDAARGNAVDRFAPEPFKPYLRLARFDRPIGWWLLLLPCWWSAALAAVAAGMPWPNPLHLMLFMVGAITMRGAGCVYNDIIDRDLDRKVARTRNRPLASGAVSVTSALLFLALLGLVGLAVLASFNGFSIILGFCSLIPVMIYPFMKRITSWPQAVLGLAFAWGGLMGWAAVFGSLSAPAFLIYIAAVLWTIGYDTIYAVQDFEDDAVAGIRSTTRLFGDRTQLAVGSFFAVAVLCLMPAFVLAHVGLIGWLGLLGFAAHLGWQVGRIDLADPHGALVLFRSNRDAGLILFGGLCADAFFRF